MYAWLNMLGLTNGRRASGFLRSTNDFRTLLEHERMRADRNGHVFSMLTFTPQSKTAGACRSTLAPVLRDRLRATDIAGTLENQLVAVILPDTDAAGAWQLADDVCHLLPDDLPKPSCAVYEYPTDPPHPPKTSNGAAQHEENHDNEQVAFADLLVRATPVWKRSMDVVGASIGLILTAPIMLLAMIAIKLTSRGPAIFKQTRAGLGEKPFEMYKFRTMVVDAEARRKDLIQYNENDGPAFKMTRDPRITTVGWFLRRTSIDELPQLWNILCGNMSLVGPRPLPCNEAEECRNWQHRRHDVNPGLTCIWQVKGRSRVSFADWARMDLAYVTSRSFAQDIKLLLLTIPAVISCRGAR